ncbi:MAG: heme biosynthesis protein HemY, partial [Pseudomonas sp.]|nr:heme biosynthesis protein HemY [Pseudomonas sp.]
MKRFYVILVLAIALALALAVGISKHTGYVLITYPHVLHYESGLWSTLVAVFVVGLAIYLLRVLLGLVTTSGGV